MVNLKHKLEKRIEDNFFGSKVKNHIKNFSKTKRNEFQRNALNVYERSLIYINKYYDFENSPMETFGHLNILKRDLKFKNVLKIGNVLNLELDEDKLYDEINTVNEILQNIRKTHTSVEEAWVFVLKTAYMSELQKIVSKTLSIPVSNAFVERIFSIMESVWGSDRGKKRVELVKAELCIRINFDMECDEFLDYLKKPDQKHLLNATLKQRKFNFRK